jgi:protein required for attachment to host cells
MNYDPIRYIVVITNASVFRLYEFTLTKSGGVKFLKAMTNPDSRKRNLDIATDKPGRAKKDYRIQRIAFSSTSEPKEVEKGKFIKKLEKELNGLIKDDPDVKFIFIAEPSFIGNLNVRLSTKILSRIEYRINKDLSFIKELELSNILKAELKPILIPL